MPVTQAEHDRRLKVPAVCELLPLRDLPLGDNIMVRTNGAFVAGYELRGILAYFATDGERNQNKSMLEALFRSVPDVSMRVQFQYEISEHHISHLIAPIPTVRRPSHQGICPPICISVDSELVAVIEGHIVVASTTSSLVHALSLLTVSAARQQNVGRGKTASCCRASCCSRSLASTRCSSAFRRESRHKWGSPERCPGGG